MSDLPAAPYPADTRAKGWRFELDLEQVRQSTTWARAKPEARAWLLMLWAVSWEQVPCGSLPDDREAVAGLLGIPDELWERHADALLRGWWPAGDGRLYHDTLAIRVAEMMKRRRSDSDRQAANRARLALESAQSTPGVTRDKQVTPSGVGAESSTDNRQPIQEKEKDSPPPPVGGVPPVAKPRKTARAVECPDGVTEQTWADWLALRAKKRAPVTATVLGGAVEEAAKASMTLEAFLKVWCQRGSQGLQAEWLRPAERGHSPPAQTFRERDQDLAAARVHEMTGGLVSAKPAKPLSIEDHHAPFQLG